MSKHAEVRLEESELSLVALYIRKLLEANLDSRSTTRNIVDSASMHRKQLKETEVTLIDGLTELNFSM